MTNKTLDQSTAQFQQLLNKSMDLVLQQFEDLDSKKAYHLHPQQEVASWFDEALPEEGMDAMRLLDAVKEKVLDKATGNLGPHMYAYVMAGGTQISIVAEQLASLINQNMGKWHLGPSLNEIERRVIEWGANMISYGDNVGGILLSGGSAANLAGLTVARNLFFEKKEIRKKGLFNQAPMIAYASKEVHGCIDKSMELLGLGTEQLRKIDTNGDFTVKVDLMEQQIQADLEAGLQPFCIVGSAGTVNTGAIDDLNALAALAKKYELWFHVDGAYGGLVASLASLKHKYQGIELADSLAIDYHKWLYQPFEAGCIMVKNWNILKRAYYKNADYLDTAFEGDQGRLEFNEHHFQLSRNDKSLKVWMTFKAYGAKLLKEMIQKDIDLAKYLADLVEQAADFELKARSDLAIACFRYKGELVEEEAIAAINERLIAALEKDGRVFITGTKLNGEFVLRACLINHRKTKATTEYLLQVIREVAAKIEVEQLSA